MSNAAHPAVAARIATAPQSAEELGLHAAKLVFD